MKFKLFLASALLLLSVSSHSAEAVNSSVMNVAVARLGTPDAITPIKNGDEVVAVVWRYPSRYDGYVSVILMDGKAVSITIDGIPHLYLKPRSERAALNLRLPDLKDI